jgi:4-hydroxybenzoate polyprenyltransferase
MNNSIIAIGELQETAIKKGSCGVKRHLITDKDNKYMQSKLNERIIAFIEITRPWFLPVLLPILIAPAFIGSNGHPPYLKMLIAVVSFAFLKSSSTVFNDYFDRNIDAMIHKNRPIPSGRISEKEAINFGTLLMVLGLIGAYFVNLTFFILGLFSTVFYLLHIWKIKKTVFIPGIATIGTNVSMSLIALGGWSIVSSLNLLSLYLTLIVFFWDMGHDTASSIRDYNGDKSEGLQSFAIRFGIVNASKIVIALFILVIFMSFWLSILVKLYFLMHIIIFSSLFMILPFFRLLRNPNTENAASVHKMMSWYPIAMFTYIILEFI